ncbi:MAG TPA: XdhC family protein [Gemmatimonadaceae bacterium]|nr:XdhC family protein [Gemmatimonadaceae bacterium]
MKQWLETRQILARIAELQRDGVRAALATVVRVRGSAYRHEGAKLVVSDDGRSVGNVSGGCLEEDVREVARQVIASGVSEVRTYCGGSSEVDAWDLGVGCDGEVEILIEPVLSDRAAERRLVEAESPFIVITRLDRALAGDQRSPDDAAAASGELQRVVVTGEPAVEWLASGHSRMVEQNNAALFVDVMIPPPRLLVVSAGDDACHLARLASEVGFRVVVADRRPGLLTADRFPSSVRLLETDAARLSERVVLDADSFAVVMTHHFADDTDYLRALLRSPARYLGVLGPRQRMERILGILREEGPVDESRIFGPVGLDIGTDGAEQVALSTLAEILAVRSGRGARSLRDRRAPIHASRE